jgi:D-alanyl-D-alanine carboxypeptidase
LPANGQRRWINGCAHALLVTCDRRGLAHEACLLRKRDLARLAHIVVREGTASCPHRQATRDLPGDARAELAWLLSRLDARMPKRLHRTRPRVSRDWLAGLDIPAELLAHYHLPRQPEPAVLVEAGHDLYGRPLWLTAAAAAAWRRLADAARNDGIALQAVSGFRSAAYQHALLLRKRAQGQDWRRILATSALPGFSEHHLGTTLDLHAGDGPALEESFGDTEAFAWLQARAHRYGFRLSYPRGNPLGVAYEPWHWRWHPPGAA